MRDLLRSLRGGEPSLFFAALVAAPLLRVVRIVLDLELCTPAMARTDEEGLMRRKVE